MPTDRRALYAPPDSFDPGATGYALSKQIGTAHELATGYGPLPLDPELADAVERALRPILERRLRAAGRSSAS